MSIVRSLTFLTLGVLAGCGPQSKDDDGPVDTYVGTVSGSDALVAIAVQGDGDVIAYSCGGELDLQVMTTWISGARTGDTFELERGDGTISGTIGDGVVTGFVELDVMRAFTATLTVPGEPTGLFGAGMDDRDCLTGVVVLPGGYLQGASTCGAADDMFNQVTPGAVPPVDDTGFEVTVVGWSAAPFLVTPVKVAPRY